MSKFLRTAVIVSLASAAPAFAAPGQVVLKGDVMVEKTVVVDGVSKVQLVEPKSVLPGEKLLFTTTYANTGAAPVTNFVVTNPIPAAVVVSPEAAASLLVSVDGGKVWDRLAALQVADGKGGRRAALAADVTHVRWTIPAIAPGATGKVQYRAIVR